KHPFAAGGLSLGQFRYLTRRLERRVLRGPRPGDGFDGLRVALDEIANSELRAQLRAWLDGLDALFAPFVALVAGTAGASALVRANVTLAEALAATDKEDGAARLWAQDAGEALAEFIDDLSGAAADFPHISGAVYPRFFDACLAGRVVRPRYGGHPR